MGVSGLPLQVRDLSNPPVQVSGGTLQGISNTVVVSGTVSVSGGPITVQPPTSNGLTITGTVATTQSGSWSTTISGQPLTVQAPTTNGLTITGTVTSTPSGVQTVSVSGQPLTVQAPTSNGLTVTGTVVVTPSGTQNVSVTSVGVSLPVQAASTSGLTITGTATVNQGTNPWVVSMGSNTLPVQAATTTGLTVTASNLPTNLAQLGGTTLSGANVVDTGNTALRVNVVAGSLGGGSSVTAVQAATLNGLTVNGSFSTSLSGTLPVISASLTGMTITGTVAVSNLSSPGVTPVLAATSTGLTVTGTVSTKEISSSTSTVSVVDFTQVVDATRDIVLLNANASRRSATIFNNTDANILINEGAVASMVTFSDILVSGSRLILDPPGHTTSIHGYLPVIPNGKIYVTERT